VQGYIKDHRKELESDIWMMPPLYHRTWQWLKYNVNHDDAVIPMRDGSQFHIKRGQKLTSIRDVAKGIMWWEGTKEKVPNPKTVSTILEWMEKTGMIKIDRGHGNRQYTLITLIKYEIYQEKLDQGNSKVTAKKQYADINNNDKNDKEKNNTTTDDELFNTVIPFGPTEEDLNKVEQAYFDLHKRLFTPKEWPDVTKAVKEHGVDHVIKVMEDRLPAASGEVNSFRYYLPAMKGKDRYRTQPGRLDIFKDL